MAAKAGIATQAANATQAESLQAALAQAQARTQTAEANLVPLAGQRDEVLALLSAVQSELLELKAKIAKSK